MSRSVEGLSPPVLLAAVLTFRVPWAPGLFPRRGSTCLIPATTTDGRVWARQVYPGPPKEQPEDLLQGAPSRRKE